MASSALAEAPSQSPTQPTETQPAVSKIILLVRTRGDDNVMARVRAELEMTAWRIVEIRLDGRFEAIPLRQLALQQSATAAIRVNIAKGEIELWVTKPSGAVEETLTTPGELPPDHVLAVRATEALRARGLDLAPAAASHPDEQRPAKASPAPAPTSGEAAAPEPKQSSAEALPRRVWLELAPAITVSTGGLGATPQGLIGVRLELVSAWSVSAFGLVPMASQRVTGAEGSADVSIALVGGALDVAWFRSRTWELGTGAGVGAAIATMEGDPQPNYWGGRDTVGAAMPFLRWGARVGFGGGWYLSGGVLGGATFPRISVYFEEREVASWGRPFGAATLGIEAPILGGHR